MAMETIIRRCAGLDVHKDSVQACVRVLGEDGRLHQHVRGFGTTTGQLLALADQLDAEGVTHVAMESTGVYWKPIWNLLEGRFTVWLVNARHIKNVPGRKTDVKDCQWIAQLLQHGLLKPSFVPERPQRELRDLTRLRAQMAARVAQGSNRIQKVLEDANVKLGSVATNVLGVSGRSILRQLIAGQDDPAALAAEARGRLRRKSVELRQALAGRVTEHHRFVLGTLLDELEQTEAVVAKLQERIDQATRPLARELALLDTIPGVDVVAAQALLAEVGADMGRFPSEHHLASWAGVCPGNHESAGKRRSGRTNTANRWLRRVLVQSAWAASHKRDSYLSAQYRRLVGRRGKKRALMALAHSILVGAYHMLKRGEPFKDLGGDYFERVHADRLTHSLVKRLQDLGHTVVLDPAA